MVALSFAYLPLLLAHLVSKHHSTKTSRQVQESITKNLEQKNEECLGNETVFQEQLEKYKQDLQELQDSYDTSLTEVLKLQAKLGTFKKENEALLFRGAKLGDLDLVKHVLKLNVSLSATDKDKATPLHWAAHNGQVEVVQFLLDAGADTEVENYQGNTPLIWAAHNGHERVCRALLEHGAKANVVDKHRNTPLHYAAMFGYLPVVQLLVQYGGSKTAINEKGRIPLDEAVRSRKYEVADWLMIKKPEHSTVSPELLNQKNVDDEWFIERAANGDYLLVSLALKKGILNVSATDSEDRSALHMAALNGHVHVTEMLLEAGANMESRNKEGNTPLILAAHNNHIEVCRSLLQHGANVNVANAHKNTPLHYAAMFGYFPLVKMLVMHGANISSINNKGLTPKGEALRTKEFQVVIWLSEFPEMVIRTTDFPKIVTVDSRSETRNKFTGENSDMPFTEKSLQQLLAPTTQQPPSPGLPEPKPTVAEENGSSVESSSEDYYGAFNSDYW